MRSIKRRQADKHASSQPSYHHDGQKKLLSRHSPAAKANERAMKTFMMLMLVEVHTIQIFPKRKTKKGSLCRDVHVLSGPLVGGKSPNPNPTR